MCRDVGAAKGDSIALFSVRLICCSETIHSREEQK